MPDDGVPEMSPVPADELIAKVAKRLDPEHSQPQRETKTFEARDEHLPRKGEILLGVLIEDAAAIQRILDKNEDSPDDTKLDVSGGILSLGISEKDSKSLNKSKLNQHLKDIVSELVTKRNTPKTLVDSLIKRALANDKKMPSTGEESTT